MYRGKYEKERTRTFFGFLSESTREPRLARSADWLDHPPRKAPYHRNRGDLETDVVHRGGISVIWRILASRVRVAMLE